MKKRDVQRFGFRLEDNIFDLHKNLKGRRYAHGPYSSFYVQDPKLRHIHKATVRDRVVHQAVFRVLYHLFDKKFIYDSYSCRFEKGTHKGVLQLERFARKVSANYRKPTYVLKCDIKKFFYNVDHKILFDLINKTIQDAGALWLLEQIIKSFGAEPDRGLPLGNVTSQLFANIYLNELDQFAKHELKCRYYIRYCDDFVILNNDDKYLFRILGAVNEFLIDRLGLSIHPKKVTIRKFGQGVDFLGYVAMPHYVVLRTKTKRRMFNKLKLKKQQYEAGEITGEELLQSFNSYLGVIKHCRGYKLFQNLLGLGHQRQFPLRPL